jgi:hypothetical protein
MPYSVICPGCGEKNNGSSLSCVKCHENLIGVLRQEDSPSKQKIDFQQEAIDSLKEPEIKNLSRAFWRFVRSVILIDLLVFTITASVCWKIGWRTPDEMGLGFIYGGFFTMFIGGASMVGNPRASVHPRFGLVNPVALQAHRKQNFLDMNERFALWVVMGPAGLLVIIAGWLVQKYFS